MSGISRRFIWGLAALVSIFALLEPYIPEISIWGGRLKDFWWGLCGALAGHLVHLLYDKTREVKLEDYSEAKKFNEQLKMSSAYINAIAVAVFIFAILQKLNSGGNIFHWGTLIAIWVSLYFHYNAIRVLDLWKPEK